MKIMKSKWTAQIASAFAGLVAIVCPLCIPALGAFLASAGLGFAVNVSFLKPLLVIFLVLAVGSLAWSAKMHRRWWVVFVGIIGAALMYVGRYVWFNQILMWGGAMTLIGVSIVNLRIKMTCRRCE
jgi:NADH:ubiquinone oxidoreductase subunit 6 (subunit J)